MMAHNSLLISMLLSAGLEDLVQGSRALYSGGKLLGGCHIPVHGRDSGRVTLLGSAGGDLDGEGPDVLERAHDATARLPARYEARIDQAWNSAADLPKTESAEAVSPPRDYAKTPVTGDLTSPHSLCAHLSNADFTKTKLYTKVDGPWARG